MVTHLKDKFNAVSREGKVGKGDAGIVDDDADGLGAGQQGIGTGAHAGEVGRVDERHAAGRARLRHGYRLCSE